MDPLATDRPCCRAIKRKMLKTHNELDRRMTEMENSMKRQMKDVQRILNKVNVSLLSLMDQNNIKEPRTMFPLQTEEQLCEMDIKISVSPGEFIALFERMLMPEGIIKNIERVLSTDLLMKYNFAGTSKKEAFDKFVHLNNAMYESMKEDDYSFVDYKRDIREAFAKAKGRRYKSKSRVQPDDN